jgi:hypothetical protein
MLVSRKLKPGGLIYVEIPSIHLLVLPSMQGTLNFCDDETHICLYDEGRRQHPARQRHEDHTERPASMHRSNSADGVRWHELRGGWFWDLLGFADFVFG